MSEHEWLALERLDVAPLVGRWSVVRMRATLGEQPSIPPIPRLCVRRPQAVSEHGAFVNAADRRGSQLLWLASFAVPLEIVHHPDALFELTAPGYPAIALPAPGTFVLPLSARTELRLARRFPQLRIGRRATAMATAVAISATGVQVTGLAVAKPAPAHRVDHGAGGRESLPGVEGHPVIVAHVALPDKPVVKLASAPAAPAQQASPPSPDTTLATAAPPDPSASPVAPHKPVKPAGPKTSSSPVKATPSPVKAAPKHAPTPPSTPTRTGWQTPPAQAPKADAPHQRHRRATRHHGHGHRMTLPTGGAPIAPLTPNPPSLSSHPAPSPTPSPAPIAASAIPAGGGSLTLGSTGASGTSAAVSYVPPPALLARIYGDLQGPPPFLVAIYKQAENRYHVPWQILAAINSIETNYGRDLSVSSAGAEGWMQFMPETWAQWGVDANHDGKKDPYDPRDAIFAAARYLRANGAPQRMREAVFAYNHADWYVEDVIRRAQWIADTAGVPVRGRAGQMIKAMKAKADELIGLPYVWGGGHGGWELVSGYDCSGFVSTVLHAAGYLSSPQTTDTLPGQPGIEPGPGQYVTIFDRTGSDGHVIIDLNGTFYESGGSATGGGGAGVKRIQPPLDYLVTFNTILHPRGL